MTWCCRTAMTTWRTTRCRAWCRTCRRRVSRSSARPSRRWACSRRRQAPGAETQPGRHAAFHLTHHPALYRSFELSYRLKAGTLRSSSTQWLVRFSTRDCIPCAGAGATGVAPSGAGGEGSRRQGTGHLRRKGHGPRNHLPQALHEVRQSRELTMLVWLLVGPGGASSLALCECAGRRVST